MTLIDTPAKLAGVLREWLLQYPEKVLFGDDAAAFGPDSGLARRVDWHDYGTAGARDRAVGNGQERRGEARSGRRDGDDGDAHQQRETVQLPMK